MATSKPVESAIEYTSALFFHATRIAVDCNNRHIHTLSSATIYAKPYVAMILFRHLRDRIIEAWKNIEDFFLQKNRSGWQ